MDLTIQEKLAEAIRSLEKMQINQKLDASSVITKTSRATYWQWVRRGNSISKTLTVTPKSGRPALIDIMFDPRAHQANGTEVYGNQMAVEMSFSFAYLPMDGISYKIALSFGGRGWDNSDIGNLVLNITFSGTDDVNWRID